MRRQKRVGLIAGLWLLVMLLMTACQGDEKETAPETSGTQISTEDGLTENPGPEEVTEASTESSVQWYQEEPAGEELVLLTVEEAKETEAQLISELWRQVLGNVYRDYGQKAEYQISAYVEKFPVYSDLFVDVELFCDRSIHRSGVGFDRQTELNVWTELEPEETGYSEADVQTARENSVFVVDGTISKIWTDAFQPYVESETKQKAVAQVCEMMIGTAGQLYQEKTSGIEGSFSAKIYLTEHSIDKSALKCTYWICFEGDGPICVTGTYRKTAEAGEITYNYEVLSTVEPEEAALAESAVLTIDVQLNTEVMGNGKLLGYAMDAENAERVGVSLQKELAMAVLEGGLWNLQTVLQNTADGIITQEVYIPWLREKGMEISAPWLRHEVITMPVIVEGENPLLGSSGGGAQIILREDRIGAMTLTEDGYRFEIGDVAEGNRLPDEYGVRIFLQSSLDIIGEVPLGIESEGDADRCKAAELLFGAAFRYLAENSSWVSESRLQLEHTMYLIDSNYDLDAPEGEFLIQNENDETPAHIKIVFDGSCRDEVTGYTVWNAEEKQTFYEVKNAVCLKNTVNITLNNSWLYSAYLMFEQYDEEIGYAGEHGEFVGETQDYDGDGTDDRVFLYSEMEGADEAVLFLGDGSVFRLDQVYDGVEWCLDPVDLTGDGVPEVVFQSMKGMSPLMVYERTADGLQEMVFRYTVGGDEMTIGQARRHLPIEKIKDSFDFRYIRPDGSGEVLFTLTEGEAGLVWDGVSSDGTAFYYVAGDTCELVKDTEADRYLLHMTGRLIPQIRVEWDLVYEDGVWVEKNITQTREELVYGEGA